MPDAIPAVVACSRCGERWTVQTAAELDETYDCPNCGATRPDLFVTDTQPRTTDERR